MTIASTVNRTSYNGNTVTTVFSYPYRFLANADLVVYVDDVLKVLTTDYTLTGAGGASGGNVTMLTPPPTGTGNVVVYRDPEIVQETDWVENDPDPAAQKEDAFDLLTTVCQRLAERMDRSFQLADSDVSGIDLTLPEPVASKLIAIDSAGTALALADFIDNIFVDQEAEPATDGSLYFWQKTSTGTMYYLNVSVWTAMDDGSSILGGDNTWTGTNTWDETCTQNKGVDVASATALPLIADGNVFDVTGTTTVTSIATLGVGTTIKLQFDGALTLTHHATDLVLPTGANITTAAGDVAEFFEYATGDWRCTNYERASGLPLAETARYDKVVQVVNTSDGALASTTTVVPRDDTIPQNTEGGEFMTLAITPTNSSNKLKIEVTGQFSSTGANHVVMALFQDSTADALAVGSSRVSTADGATSPSFVHYMTAGTTSSTTFKVRAGPNVAATVYFNGESGARLFGGVYSSTITITEIAV